MDSGIPDSGILESVTCRRIVSRAAGVLATAMLLACEPERPPTGIIHRPGDEQRALAEVRAEQRQREEDAAEDARVQEQIAERRFQAERREQEARARAEAERWERERQAEQAALHFRPAGRADQP